MTRQLVDFVSEFLEELTKRFPPQRGHKHALMLRGDGEPGFQVQLSIPGDPHMFTSFLIGVEDSGSTYLDIADAIAKILEAK